MKKAKHGHCGLHPASGRPILGGAAGPRPCAVAGGARRREHTAMKRTLLGGRAGRRRGPVRRFPGRRRSARSTGRTHLPRPLLAHRFRLHRLSVRLPRAATALPRYRRGRRARDPERAAGAKVLLDGRVDRGRRRLVAAGFAAAPGNSSSTAIDSGQLEVAAMPFNQTPFLDAAQWERLLHWLPEDLWQKFHPAVALQNDVNGFPRRGPGLARPRDHPADDGHQLR